MNNGFQFKQFFIAHDQCAMKVNTDAILLGSIVNVENVKSVADLGTGTGVVAIMLAQRTACDCQIFAIEIEPKAYKQATENIQRCQWAERIKTIHADIMQLNLSKPLDLIVANPPYFENSVKNAHPSKTLARHTLQSHIKWLAKSAELLAINGKISFILPFNVGQNIVMQAKEIGLHCIESWIIYPTSIHPPKRIVLTFSAKFAPMRTHQLTIYQTNNQYSEAFKMLTANFYLNF